MKQTALIPLISLVLQLLLLNTVSHADAQAITPEFLEEALNDAQREYEAQKDSGPPRNREPIRAAKFSKDEMKDMLTKLTSGSAGQKESLLEELAQQVDALKNKVIIERTTLLATQSPRKVKVNGAKTVFNFQDTAIYELTSALDHVTDIQLKPGESLTTPPTAGDTVRWNIGVMRSGNPLGEVTHLIVKPLDEDIETNLIITTDQHVYQLHLKSGDFHTPVVSWNYPEDVEAKLRQAIHREEIQEVTVRPENLRFTYNILGEDVKWKPVRVFDDGMKTFIQMPQQMRVSDAPVLFLLDKANEPLLVNYRVKGDYYIVDRLFDGAELRVGPEETITIELDDGKNWFDRLFS
jgi:P-type conjugative transfer protein TrbG